MADDLDWDDNSDAQFRVNCERLLTLWQTELEPIEQTVLKELQRQFFYGLRNTDSYFNGGKALINKSR